MCTNNRLCNLPKNPKIIHSTQSFYLCLGIQHQVDAVSLLNGIGNRFYVIEYNYVIPHDLFGILTLARLKHYSNIAPRNFTSRAWKDNSLVSSLTRRVLLKIVRTSCTELYRSLITKGCDDTFV